MVFVETKCLVSRNVNFELKYIKTDTSVSRQNTQKSSLVRVTVGVKLESHIRSESQSRGPRPRRLTKALQPPSKVNFKKPLPHDNITLWDRSDLMR